MQSSGASPPQTPDSETARVLGRLEAHVSTIDDRLDRLEASYTARLSAIETKLDHVAQSLAQGLGALRIVHWLGALALAVIGFLVSHVWHNRG